MFPDRAFAYYESLAGASKVSVHRTQPLGDPEVSVFRRISLCCWTRRFWMTPISSLLCARLSVSALPIIPLNNVLTVSVLPSTAGRIIFAMTCGLSVADANDKVIQSYDVRSRCSRFIVVYHSCGTNDGHNREGLVHFSTHSCYTYVHWMLYSGRSNSTTFLNTWFTSRNPGRSPESLRVSREMDDMCYVWSEIIILMYELILQHRGGSTEHEVSIGKLSSLPDNATDPHFFFADRCRSFGC